MSDQPRTDKAEENIEREEHLDAETIAEDAEELFRKKAPEGQGDILQPDNPPPPEE